MLVKALKSFVGVISMRIGETREIVDEKFAQGLIKAGHAIEVKAEKGKKDKEEASKPAEEQAEAVKKK